ncbi:uncharacterized protein LOC106877207 isoform X3 [Octopus bimaculoides]|uniref:uncharacterized protein LOC106877207 isoform X3 n=1 Tax=Octopus bimaculoides TaxID=37653 RepID=UPI0022E53592|nr:uncharacterized protein LOC106877207 isoform X3 [Octopus bimaculoides]
MNKHKNDHHFRMISYRVPSQNTKLKKLTKTSLITDYWLKPLMKCRGKKRPFSGSLYIRLLYHLRTHYSPFQNFILNCYHLVSAVLGNQFGINVIYDTGNLLKYQKHCSI